MGQKNNEGPIPGSMSNRAVMMIIDNIFKIGYHSYVFQLIMGGLKHVEIIYLIVKPPKIPYCDNLIYY